MKLKMIQIFLSGSQQWKQQLLLDNANLISLINQYHL